MAFRNLTNAADADRSANSARRGKLEQRRDVSSGESGWPSDQPHPDHALSYSITSVHGVPHGIAVAINLLPLLRFNWYVTDDDCADPRGAQAVRQRSEQLFTALQFGGLPEARDVIGRWLAAG